MSMCPYCGQTNTRKDDFGYCRKYRCKFTDEYEKLSIEAYKRNYIEVKDLNTGKYLTVEIKRVAKRIVKVEYEYIYLIPKGIRADLSSTCQTELI